VEEGLAMEATQTSTLEEAQNLRRELREREKSVLAALGEYFDCAATLATVETESLARDHRSLANLKAQLASAEARLQEIAREQSKLRNQAAQHLLDGDEDRARALRNKHEGLASDREATGQECEDLRSRIGEFVGIPQSALELAERNAIYRGALTREADALQKRLHQIHRERTRKLTTS
jgi:hypothetical protein